MSKNIENEIKKIEGKLIEKRKEWKIASPVMKKWIEQGAKLLLNEKKMLEKELKKELEKTWQEKLID